MKNRFKLLAITGIVTFVVLSCEKQVNEPESYIDNILGLYEGELTSEKYLEVSKVTAHAEISMWGEDMIEIHCYGEDFDTTFVMDVYQHYDSVMVCFNGEGFINEYGHISGHNMHNMHINIESDWMHHLDDEHNSDDVHYGGFNMMDHSFEYNFRMMDGNLINHMRFHGKMDH